MEIAFLPQYNRSRCADRRPACAAGLGPECANSAHTGPARRHCALWFWSGDLVVKERVCYRACSPDCVNIAQTGQALRQIRVYFSHPLTPSRGAGRPPYRPVSGHESCKHHKIPLTDNRPNAGRSVTDCLHTTQTDRALS